MRLLTVGLLALAVGGASQTATTARQGGNWTRFAYDAARSNSGPARTGITAANVGKLRRQQVRLPGTADSSPIYLRGVLVKGRRHDVFFVTTSYGITVAVDSRSGKILWRFNDTPVLSTYITALVAGPYHEVRDRHHGIDLGLYCRKSLAEFLDPDELFTVTKQGFDFFHRCSTTGIRSANMTSSSSRSSTRGRWRTPQQ